MNKRRLILTSMVGATALLAVSLSFSLAWYSSGDRLAVSTVDISVKTDPLLKVSTSNELSSFVDELDLNSDEFEEESEKFLFKPVSTMYRDDWLNSNAREPAFYDSSFVAVVDGENRLEATQGFYQKKIYLLTEANYYVGLDMKNSLFENDETANHIRAQEFYASKENEELGLSVEQIEESLKHLKECLRVSILINDVEDDRYINNRFNIINPTKEEDEKVYFGGLLDNDNDGYFDTVPSLDQNNEPIKKEYVYGEINDRSLMKYKDPEIPGYDDERLPSAAQFHGNSFRGEHRKSAYTYDEAASTANHLEFKEEGAMSLTEVEDFDKGLIIPCYANQPREIVLSIYLEGWDLDCINGTMGASFNTKLSFKILRGLI